MFDVIFLSNKTHSTNTIHDLWGEKKYEKENVEEKLQSKGFFLVRVENCTLRGN